MNPEQLAKSMAVQVKAAIAAALAPVNARIAVLEAKTVELQTRGLAYRGVFQRADRYGRGDAVTHKSGLWIALRETNHEPGSSGDWQLACKGGTQ